MHKVLVTGGTGFVGANLVRAIVARGDEVHLFVREGSNFWRLQDIKEKLHLHTGEIGDASAVQAIFAAVQPRTVFHLAVQGSNPGVQGEASRIAATNVRGTENILNACAASGCILVNTGSSSEYGMKNTPMREDDELRPNSLYGETKSQATSLVHSVAAEQRLPVVTLRLFSPFGYFDHAHRLIPVLILAALHKKPAALYSPFARRDFVFIEDVVAAYLHFAEKAGNMPGEVINIGSGGSHSVAETVAAIEDIVGVSLNATYGAIPAKQAEPEEWVADIREAERAGWRPATSFEEGLRKTAAWFENNQSLYS